MGSRVNMPSSICKSLGAGAHEPVIFAAIEAVTTEHYYLWHTEPPPSLSSTVHAFFLHFHTVLSGFCQRELAARQIS